jgi:hypothetical protein
MKINVNFPGEKLLIHLWNSLAEKGIGSILTPWQIRREGLARLELRRAEILTIAQTEIEAQEIRSGNKTLEDLGVKVKTVPKKLSSKEITYIEPIIDEQNLLLAIEKNRIQDALRKEVNIANAITIAEEILKEDTQEAPTEAIEDDWLYRWRDYAANFSNSKLQEIWGKALAGELKSPGSYSIRCLEFLKNLSQEEANKIQALSSFNVDDAIWREDLGLLDENGLSFQTLLELQDLGIISGVESVGLNLTIESTSTTTFIRPLKSNGKLLIIEHDDASKKVSFQIYNITKIGKQVLSLGKFEPNIKYLTELGKFIKKQGFKVQIADVLEILDRSIKYTNKQELSE